MKRPIIMLLICFLFYTIYYDLAKGTLPAAVSSHEKKAPAKNYQEITVKSGDTMLSILESLPSSSSSGKLSIEKAEKEFEHLNPGVKAGMIVIGKTYRFPVNNK
ncbi:hypothetical protein LRR81_02510 [Metabacillus sp. GX 13764]|uniref:hypothetical protein n=1 Tax=Metabacillus kandeliae TaxID=2900151 RepID=UPI001E5959C4|nr:hypothetical protein [Metabacillus kandeliae]MCD7033086.1 hypothetical protein [Metabacillus kandeliae]